MRRRIELEDLSRRGAAILDDLAGTGTPCIVERDSKPVVVLVAYEDFLRWQHDAAESPDEHFDRVAERLRRLNAGLCDEVVAGDVAGATAEVRRGNSLGDVQAIPAREP